MSQTVSQRVTHTYAVVLPLLSLWLVVSIVVSWGAVQDDALIHLRYAENFLHHHLIAYDGAHRDYGASSLLYVAILAGARRFTLSANLPRMASSIVHVLLFSGLACAFWLRLPKMAYLARLAGLMLLVLLVTPSAVRWLDDGMETGLALSLVSLMAWSVHTQFVLAERGRGAVSPARYLAMLLLGFLAAMLRTELVLACGCGSLILVIGSDADTEKPTVWRRLLFGSHLLVGAGVAIGVILVSMHVLLPDTAIAKSHGLGHWFNPIHDTATTLGGAFSFGLGMLGYWLLTLLLVVLQSGRLSKSTAMANAFFPMVLALASLRGQEIPGARYFAWTFFFPIVWNVLELARLSASRVSPEWGGTRKASRGALLLSAFVALLAVETPFEVRAMYRVLTHRSQTMRAFESEHLEVLKERRGIASDIGYIGYFSGARICDLAGLVNGRATARLSSAERNLACVRTAPDFIFGSASQLASLTGLADFSAWKICGRYDFTNVRTLDSHYLAVRPGVVDEVCRATGHSPEALEGLLAAGESDRALVARGR